MEDFLNALLPRLFPALAFQCVPHEGKSDLEKRLAGKLRGWRTPGTRFVVMRDQNGADCRDVKAKLVDLCLSGGRPDALVRIVCRELEAWYLGDRNALLQAFPEEPRYIERELNKRRFARPGCGGCPRRGAVFADARLPEAVRSTDHGHEASCSPAKIRRTATASSSPESIGCTPTALPRQRNDGHARLVVQHDHIPHDVPRVRRASVLLSLRLRFRRLLRRLGRTVAGARLRDVLGVATSRAGRMTPARLTFNCRRASPFVARPRAQ